MMQKYFENDKKEKYKYKDERKYDEVVYVAIVICIAIIYLFFLNHYNGIFFPQDEFGYWSNAAKVLGIDWSEVARNQSRYAYGYSMILVPVLCLFNSSPVIAYRIAILINALLLAVYVKEYHSLLKKIFRELPREMYVALTILGTFTPYIINYMHYTMAEILLDLLFVLLLNNVKEIEENVSKVKLLSGSVICLCMFVTHYRTIGIIIAYYFMIVFCLNNTAKTKRLSLLTLIYVSILCIFTFYLAVSLGYIQIEKIVNVAGLVNFALGITGKCYYAAVSTFGLGGLGLYVVYRNRRNAFMMFLMIAFTLSVLICSYFFVGGVRYDQLIYGRYIEAFLPILMSIGLVELFEGRISPKVLLAIIVVEGAISIALTLYVLNREIMSYLPNFVSGTDWMYGGKQPTIIWLYEMPFYVSTLIIAIVFTIYKINSQGKNSCMVLLVALSIVTTLISANKNVYWYQSIDKSDYELEQRIEELIEDGKELIFLNSPYNDYVNLMQFWMMDKPIRITEGLVPEAFNTPEDAIVLTHLNYEEPEQLEKRYINVRRSEHFVMYYN